MNINVSKHYFFTGTKIIRPYSVASPLLSIHFYNLHKLYSWSSKRPWPTLARLFVWGFIWKDGERIIIPVVMWYVNFQNGVVILMFVCLFVNYFAKFRKSPVSFVKSVCVCTSAWNNSAPTKRIFVKFDISVFFGNLSKKFKFS